MVVGMIVEDCLQLLLNLLKHNVSNQNFLKEGSFIQRLPSFLDIEQSGDQPSGEMWSAQKVTNVHLILEVGRRSMKQILCGNSAYLHHCVILLQSLSV